MKDHVSCVNQLEFGDLKIDRISYSVTKGDKVISLPRKEFELLFNLMYGTFVISSRLLYEVVVLCREDSRRQRGGGVLDHLLYNQKFKFY